MALDPFEFKVVADLQGIQDYQRQLQATQNISRQVGQAVEQSLSAALKDAARGLGSGQDDYRRAGRKMGDAFGDGFRSGLDGIRNLVGNFAQGIAQGVGQQITQGVSTALRQGLGALTDRTAFNSFDGAKAGLRSLGADVDDLERRAVAASKALGGVASRREILSSSYDIVSSGFQGRDAIDIAAASKKASIAAPNGTGQLADSAVIGDAATSVLNAYGLAAKDVNAVISQMIGTVNAGKIEIGEYASLIGQIASTAAGAKVPLDELNTMIATATVAGVPASSAVAGFRQAISSILKPTAEAAKYAKSLGIEFNSSALESKGFIGLLEDIKAKGAGSTEGLTQLFGSVEAVGSIAPVVSKLGKEFDSLKETVVGVNLDEAFEKGSKSVAVMAAKMEALREELALKGQTAIAPIFEAGAEAMARLLEHLNEGGVLFEGLNQAASNFRDYLAENPAVIAAMAEGIAALAQDGVNLLTQGIQQFTATLQENPTLLSDLAARLGEAVVFTTQFAQGVGEALASIVQILQPAIDLVGALSGGGTASGTMASNLGQAVTYGLALGGVVTIVSSLASLVLSISTGVAAIPGLIAGIGAAATTVGTILGGISAAAITPIVLAVGAIAITVKNIIDYTQNWGDVVLGVKQTIEDAKNATLEHLPGLDLIQGGWMAADAAIKIGWDSIRGQGEAIDRNLSQSQVFSGVWENVKGVVSGVAEAFTGLIGGAIDGLISKAQELLGMLSQAGNANTGASGLVAAGNVALGNVSGLSASAQKTLQTPGFVDKLSAVANYIGAKPQDLLQAMLYESAGSLDPAKKGPHVPGMGRATGLIQFMPETARGLGTSEGAMERMSALQQLDYVKKYFEPFKGQLGNYTQLYRTIHGGNPNANLDASDGYRTTREAIAEAEKMYGPIAKAALSVSAPRPGAFGVGGVGQVDPTMAGRATLQRTGVMDDTGLENLVLRVADAQGRVMGEYLTNSGIRSTQGNFAHRNAAGVNNPLEYGTYSIGGSQAAYDVPGMRSNFYATDPKFSTARGGIGFHLDGNRSTSPGSAGCIVFKSEADFNSFQETLRKSGAKELVFKDGRTLTQQVQQRVSQTSNAARGASSNIVGVQPKKKNGESTAAGVQEIGEAAVITESEVMRKAAEEAARIRQREDATLQGRRQAEAAKRQQDAELARQNLEKKKAASTSPEAKSAIDREIQLLSTKAQHTEQILALEQKRDDLLLARDRKVKDLASGDENTKNAAQALPDFSAQISAYNTLIGQQRTIRANALETIKLGDRANQSEADRVAAIQRRQQAAADAWAAEKAGLELQKQQAALIDPLQALQIGHLLERREAQERYNSSLQDELDKLTEIEKALAELASAGQENSPEAARLRETRKSIHESTAGQGRAYDTESKTLSLRQQRELEQGQRQRARNTLGRDEFLAGPGIEAREKVSDKMRQSGNVEGANRVAKEAAIMKQQLKYRGDLLELEERIAEFRAQGVAISEQDAQLMRQQVEAMNSLDLSNINNQFDTFKSELLPQIQDSVGGFFKTLLDGSKSVGEAFEDMLGSILDSIFTFAANQIVSSIFGGMFGGGAGMGGGGGILSILGFADGGTIPRADHSSLRQGRGAIAEALRREGPNSVLAALTPGERVLNLAQTRALEAHPVRDEILNFARGGLVPGGAMTAAMQRGGDSATINLSVQGGESSTGTDWRMVARVAQQAATAEIGRQKKPRGLLS